MSRGTSRRIFSAVGNNRSPRRGRVREVPLPPESAAAALQNLLQPVDAALERVRPPSPSTLPAPGFASRLAGRGQAPAWGGGRSDDASPASPASAPSSQEPNTPPPKISSGIRPLTPPRSRDGSVEPLSPLAGARPLAYKPPKTVASTREARPAAPAKPSSDDWLKDLPPAAPAEPLFDPKRLAREVGSSITTLHEAAFSEAHARPAVLLCLLAPFLIYAVDAALADAAPYFLAERNRHGADFDVASKRTTPAKTSRNRVGRAGRGRGSSRGRRARVAAAPRP